MIVETSHLDTIDGGMVSVVGEKNVLNAIIPVKSRTATSLSTCSIVTEQGPCDIRDVTAQSRGEDDARDCAADSDVNSVGNIAADTEEAPLPPIYVEDPPRGGCIESAILDFYSTLELGAERVLYCATCGACGGVEDMSSPGTSNEALMNASDLLAGSDTEAANASIEIMKTASQDTISTHQPSMQNAKSGDAFSVKTQGTAKSETTQHTINTMKENNDAKSIFGCSDSNQENTLEASTTAGQDPSMTMDNIISETLNIGNAEVHILDTLSDDHSYFSEQSPRSAMEFVVPKTKSLLSEIDDIESSFMEVRKSATVENMDEIKKRQDPFMEKLASIKQQLLEHQTLFESAPEDAKEEYFRAVSRAAMLNAEIETRRAELELKRIRLETMKIEGEMREMDRIMMLDNMEDTFDSMDSTKESEEGFKQAFDIFARYTSGKWHKANKNKTKDNEAEAN